MKLLFITILNFCLFTVNAVGNDSHSFFPPPDTLPPPPPGQAAPLTGPTSACVGDISEYTVEIPVACTCQWAVNGVILPDTASPCFITWTQPGQQVVSVVFIGAGGETSDPETLPVAVSGTPSQPGEISGDTFVCEYTFHTYSTTVGPYDSCEWKVNGIIQPGYSPSISYSFGAAGIYEFEVTAFNPCGTSIPRTLEVNAQGSAPAPPGPVQGPGESCEGYTEIYTTSVGPGESCEWRVDGLLQPSAGTSLEITWTERGGHLIEVRAASDCGTGNPAIKDVAVLYQPAVFLGNDTTILQGQALVLDAGNPGSDYLWSTGATTQSITVNVSGNYSVNVSNFCGADADTIEVTVFVGIEQYGDPRNCFRLITHGRNISIQDMPRDLLSIQVIDLAGLICYEGRPVGAITVDHTGIYLIRVILAETTCYQKVFIP